MSAKDALARRYRQVAWRLVHHAWRSAQQAGMITAETPAGRRFAAFGAGSLIGFPTGSVYGEEWIEIGEGTMIGAQVTLSAGILPGQDLSDFSPVLRVGDRCVIGRGSHIVAHESIVIGDDVYTGPYVYITDQNHDYADPDIPIGRQWPRNTAVSIGRGSWLGAGAIVLPGACIGRDGGGGRGLGGARPGARPMRGRGGPSQGRPRVFGHRRMGAAIPGPGRARLIRQETSHISVTMGAAAFIGGESDNEVAAQPGVTVRAVWPEPPRGHVEGSSDLVASAAYQPEPAAVAAARRFVRETLQSWLLAEQAPEGSGLVDDAVLLTSELVTNAVVHAGTPVHVTCKLADGGLEVMVRGSLPASMVPGPGKDENIPAER